MLAFLLVMGFPLSGASSGYELVLAEASLGLSASRAQLLEGWYSRLLRDRSVQMQEFQEGLGRAAFVCGALDYDRPFLAPLCAFAARHAPGSVKILPLYVLVTVEHLRRKIRQRRHCECGRMRGGRRARRRKRSGSRWLVATSEREGAGRDKAPHGLQSRSLLRTRLEHSSGKARRIV